jgi:hypothetical protein
LTVYTVSLSSQAGYTQSTDLTFHFIARGKVCGNNSSLGEMSPKVEAHNI